MVFLRFSLGFGLYYRNGRFMMSTGGPLPSGGEGGALDLRLGSYMLFIDTSYKDIQSVMPQWYTTHTTIRHRSYSDIVAGGPQWHVLRLAAEVTTWKRNSAVRMIYGNYTEMFGCAFGMRNAAERKTEALEFFSSAARLPWPGLG